MGKLNMLQQKMQDEVAKFETTMRELQELKNVSRDLKNYKKMIEVKEND